MVPVYRCQASDIRQKYTFCNEKDFDGISFIDVATKFTLLPESVDITEELSKEI